MRVVTQLSLAVAVIAGSLSLSAVANAYDGRHDRDHRRWDHRHHHYAHERTVYVRERPVFVERERPVFIAPQPMYMAPQGPSGLNLNFNIPLN